MFKSMIRALPVIGVLMATPATAAIYNITDALDPAGYPNGFGSSLFHDQTGGRMSGNTVEDPTSATGTWNSITGAISFVMNLASGGTVSVTGDLFKSARPQSSIGFDGVYSTALEFAFTGGTFGGQTMNFGFEDTFHNPEANGTDGTVISLWGDNGLYEKLGRQACSMYGNANCLGVDLRLKLEPAGTGVVPLPASVVFLLAGLGGLGGLRRFKSKAA